MSSSQSISRRTFLSTGLAGSGSIVLSGYPLNNAAADDAKELSALHPTFGTLKTQFGFKGAVLTSSDAAFGPAAMNNVWNKLHPKRLPQIVAQAADEQDVVAAVTFARANKLKVAVRGGGHNWCSPSLRHNGLLLDLTRLNKVLSVDPVARKAIVQPIVSNRDIQAALNPHGLAFPTGHCPEVKLSGYLLSGGMAWNHGEWGPGVASVEAIEIVNAAGEVITASATENADYFWAARGGGPGFFGVAIRYHLKLHALPKAITSSAYYYPYEHIVPLARWLDGLAGQLPSSVELSLFAVQAPSDLADKAKNSNGKVALVSAVMFGDSEHVARSTLAMLDSYPSLDQSLSKSVAQKTTFKGLFDASGALWPSNLRCKVDALFFNAPLSDLCSAVAGHFLAAPSSTVLLFAAYTGKNRPPATPSDAAFSMTGALYGGPWTMWQEPEHDEQNAAWHEKCIALLKPYVAGHYIGETDIVAHPEFAPASYTSAAWDRLAELRKKYDPERRFFGYGDGLG
jgi:FAD/FMN-containing dehydrogenase